MTDTYLQRRDGRVRQALRVALQEAGSKNDLITAIAIAVCALGTVGAVSVGGKKPDHVFSMVVLIDTVSLCVTSAMIALAVLFPLKINEKKWHYVPEEGESYKIREQGGAETIYDSTPSSKRWQDWYGARRDKRRGIIATLGISITSQVLLVWQPHSAWLGGPAMLVILVLCPPILVFTGGQYALLVGRRIMLCGPARTTEYSEIEKQAPVTTPSTDEDSPL
jgi:hypothetical protein